MLTTDIRPAFGETASERAGRVALALGVLALAATVFTYVLSLSDLMNPPSWVRAAGLVWLPLGFFGTPIVFTVARNGPGRRRAEAGLTVAGVSLLVFVVLLSLAG